MELSFCSPSDLFATMLVFDSLQVLDRAPNAELRAADLLVGEWELEIAPNHTRWGSLKHDQGREELSNSRFLLDPGIFAWVEQALDMAEHCSTPCSRPRIRPGRFCLGRIPGLRPGVEQVSGRMGGWLDRGSDAPVEIWPDPRILAGGGRP